LMVEGCEEVAPGEFVVEAGGAERVPAMIPGPEADEGALGDEGGFAAETSERRDGDVPEVGGLARGEIGEFPGNLFGGDRAPAVDLGATRGGAVGERAARLGSGTAGGGAVHDEFGGHGFATEPERVAFGEAAFLQGSIGGAHDEPAV